MKISPTVIATLGAGLLLPILSAACSSAPITTTATVYATNTIVKTVTATPTAAPKLSSTAVALSISAPAEYAASSLPVYITKKQTLHLNWKSDGGGFQLKVTTPGGSVVSAGAKGVNTSDTTEQLAYLGGFDFSPGDYQGDSWVDGYYYFIPTILKGAAPVKITISYWVEN